jgi:hypothetical protein
MWGVQYSMMWRMRAGPNEVKPTTLSTLWTFSTKFHRNLFNAVSNEISGRQRGDHFRLCKPSTLETTSRAQFWSRFHFPLIFFNHSVSTADMINKWDNRLVMYDKIKDKVRKRSRSISRYSPAGWLFTENWIDGGENCRSLFHDVNILIARRNWKNRRNLLSV